jgi:hypothetical protein
MINFDDADLGNPINRRIGASRFEVNEDQLVGSHGERTACD